MGSSKILFFLTFCICSVNFSVSQELTYSVSGHISSVNNRSLDGVTAILKDTNLGAFANTSGDFKISNVHNAGEYTLVVSCLGFKNQERKIIVSKNKEVFVDIVLEEDTSEIDEVVVRAKTKATKIEEQGFAVKSIDIKKSRNKTTDVTQILNQVSGVRIRSEGGVGSNYKLSLNGLSGEQIRVFMDGIPIDEMGEAFKLNNIATNSIERIDVYKGVVPIDLGADALGGAINIISNKNKSSYVDASYSIGSFNTHKATINSKYKSEKTGLFINANASYNYSDNNYTMYDLDYFSYDTEVVNGEEVATRPNVKGNVERFHDSFKSVLANVGVGLAGKKWVDELLFDFSISDIDKEIQGITQRVIGEATKTEQNKTYRLSFRKSKLLRGKLDVDVFALYNDLGSIQIDTSSNRYSWDGKYIVNPVSDGQGEYLRPKTLYEFNQQQVLYRGNFNYRFSENHHVGFNYIYSDITREGENRINADENQPFQSPNTLKKSVTGFAYTSNFFNNKLKNTVGVKLYNFEMFTRKAITFSDGGLGLEDVSTSQSNYGYLFSTRYFINSNFLIKASYEKGYRIPLPKEIFGDGLSVAASPYLLPEESNNLNLGVSYTHNIFGGFIKNEINLFQRDVKNFIRYKFSGGLVNSYVNESDVLIQGIEWDFTYYKKNLTVRANLSKQNTLDNYDYEEGSYNEFLYEKSQYPNVPILFGNLGVNYNFPKLLKNISTSFFYDFNYVDEMYLFPEKTAAANPDKNKIKAQYLQNIGTTLSTNDRKHHISFEVQNLFNQIAYDNFEQQKPGRAFYMKYRFVLNK